MSIFNETKFSLQSFVKYAHTKYNKDLTIGIRVVRYGRKNRQAC
jgi:hypothetical protein